MKRITLATGSVLVLLLLSATASAQELAAARARALAGFFSDMEELAAWCDEAKLYKFRDETYAKILELDADHEKAREVLGYTRDRDGNWKRGRYREPGNYEEALEPEFRPRFVEAIGTLTGQLLAALEAADPKESPASYKLAIADVLAVDPDNLKARNLNGEDRLDGKWVLLETARSVKRAEEIRELAAKALDAVAEPAEGEPTDEEKDLGVSWKACFEGERWRGCGTVSASELKKAVKTLDAVAPFFVSVFEAGTTAGAGRRFYLLRGVKEAEKVLTKHPAFDENKRKFLLQLKAAWLPYASGFFQWNDSAQLRLDGSTRNAFDPIFQNTFGLTTKQGWAWEGLGLYLDYLISGSRRTVFVTGESHTTTEKARKLDIERRMKSPGADWLKLAADMLDAAVEPDLRSLVLMAVDDMTAEDLIYSYALATFILEGVPEKATHFFIRMGGSNVALAEVVEEVYDRSYTEWQKRFERWLRERTN